MAVPVGPGRLSSRFWYACAQGGVAALLSMLLGLATNNPNWSLNIPLGFLLGGIVGWFLWPILNWIIKQAVK